MPAAYLKAPEISVIQFCTKIPYESREGAVRLLKSFVKQPRPVQIGVGVLNVYRCPICKGWHIGHA